MWQWFDRLIFKEFREVVAPLTREGVDLHAGQGYLSASQFEGLARPENLTPSTVILGHGGNGGHGEWEITVPPEVRNRLIDATLRIETVRTHGMLHSPQYGTRASVYMNGELVDGINLVRPGPYGEEFGIDSRRPYPILRFIDITRDIQTVRIDVDNDVYWDIDRVSIEGVVLRREIRPSVAMVVGAILSALIGALLSRCQCS